MDQIGNRRGVRNREPFARMECPAFVCTYGPSGTRKEGSVPGMKRHYLQRHGGLLSEVQWPAIHSTVSGSVISDGLAVGRRKPLFKMQINELRQEAARLGILASGTREQLLAKVREARESR